MDQSKEKFTSLVDAVAFWANRSPEAEALRWQGRSWSYTELNTAAKCCAEAMIAAGIRKGDRVAVLSPPRPEVVISMLAAFYCGAVWVGLNPKYTLRELSVVLDNAQPAMLISVLEIDERKYHDDITQILKSNACIKKVVSLDSEQDGYPSFKQLCMASHGKDRRADYPNISARDPALIVYTSGSTGAPKGAVLPHYSFIHCHKAVAGSFQGIEHLKSAGRVLVCLPINHTGCLLELIGNTLIDGSALVFQERFDPAAVLEAVQKEKITALGGVPLMLQMLMLHPSFDPDKMQSLRIIGWGGAALPQSLVAQIKAMGVHCFTNYGLTEGGSVNTFMPPDASIEQLSNSVGYPDSDHAYRLVVDDGRDAQSGEVGEIWMKGPGVFVEYFRDEASTAQAFADGGWFRTGDLAELRADGMWRIVGRIKEMFKSGGYNIYPREIEIVLESCPQVAMAAVMSVPDQSLGERGVAFIMPAARDVSIDEIKVHCRGQLANYKIPKDFVFMEQLPMLPIGKVDKVSLKKMAAGMLNAKAVHN